MRRPRRSDEAELRARRIRNEVERRLRRRWGADRLTIRERILEDRDNLRATSLDPIRHSQGGYSDPTGSSVVFPTPSTALADIELLDSTLALARDAFTAKRWVEAAEAYDALVPIVQRYELRTTSTKAQRETANSRGLWCSNCRKVKVNEPISRGDLCRWCDDHRRATGVLPDEVELRARHTLGSRHVRCHHRPIEVER